MIHLCYAFYSFRFRTPQKTSSFRFVLLDAAYLPFEEVRFVVSQASHNIITNDAR